MFQNPRISPRTRQRRRIITMRIVGGALAVSLWSAAPVMALFSQARDGTHACDATQPVYDTLGLVVVGNWTVILAPGQSATLPDGDTATCQNGTLYVH